MTGQEILITFTNGEFWKEMYFSKNTIVKDALTQFLNEIKEEFLVDDSKVSHFLYKGELLTEVEYLNKRFSDIKSISNKNRIKIIFTTRYEGGGDLIEFCDVSNGKEELVNSNMIYGTPDKGINIYGYCKNYSCIAYNQEVVVHINKKYFDLLSEKHDLKCPICKNIIIPNTVGFLQCEYKVREKKEKL